MLIELSDQAFVGLDPRLGALAEQHGAEGFRLLEGVAAPPGWPLLRSLIAGGHRHVGVKYFAAYWDEARWRDAHRSNPHAFRDTVLALLEHPWLPFDSLVHGAADALEEIAAPGR